MTRHYSPSPEDRFNDYLDALASGQSTPDASDLSAGTNAKPSIPDDAARELHDLARAADSRQGGPPEHLWETIMNEGTASPGSASIDTANPWEGTVPDRSRSRQAPDHPQPISAGARHASSPQRGSILRWARRFTPAASAAILLLIVVGIVALGTPWSRLWPEETPPVRLPALSGSLPATPSSTPVPDVNTCVANNGLVYRTSLLSGSSDITSKVVTAIDGDDQVVAGRASSVFASGVDDIAIGIDSIYSAYDQSSGSTWILGYATTPRVDQIQFGPWIVAPGNPYRTDWTVTYLPTMEQTFLNSAYPGNEFQPYSVTPKVSADGTTLALAITPDDPGKGAGNALPVEPSMLILTEQAPTGLFTMPLAAEDLAPMANLVALSPDGSKLSVPATSRIGTNEHKLSLVIWDISGPSINFLVDQPLDDHIDEGFAFFSPSGSTLNYVIDGTVGTVGVNEQSQSADTGTYEGALYGAVIAPGGEGALLGLRQTAAESPSAWVWMDGTSGEIRQVKNMEHFMFTHVHIDPNQPHVVTTPVMALHKSNRETGPSMVFFDPASGTVVNELRDIAEGRIAGIGGYWTIPSTDGSLILTRLDDEAFIKANRPSTGEQWAIPVPDGIPTTKLAAIPSPDGTCIALTDLDAPLNETPSPIWVVTAQPGAEPVLVAEGWFANWYQAPVTTGP